MRRLIRWFRQYQLAMLRADLELAQFEYRAFVRDTNRRIDALEQTLLLEERA